MKTFVKQFNYKTVMEKIFDYTQLAIRLKPEDIERIDEYYEILTGSSERPNNHREFLLKVINKVIEDFKKRPSKKEDVLKIEELESIKIQLESKLFELNQTAYNLDKKLNETNNELVLKISELEKEKEEITEINKSLTLEVEELKSNKFELKYNQVIVTLSKFHWQLAQKFLKSDRQIKLFEKQNKEGEWNGIVDVIDTDNEKQNIANLLTNALTFTTKGFRFLKGIVKKRIFDIAVKKHVENNKKLISENL